MKTLLVAVTASTGLLAGTAMADFSFGASAGYVTIADDEDDLDFEGSDVGFKAFASWMFSDFIGIEGGYVDFGEPDDNILDVPREVAANGWNLYLVGNIPLSDHFDIFAKAGAIRWEADTTIDGLEFGNDDGTDLAISGGLRWNITDNIGVRAELDWYDVSEADKAWMAGAGLEIRF